MTPATKLTAEGAAVLEAHEQAIDHLERALAAIRELGPVIDEEEGAQASGWLVQHVRELADHTLATSQFVAGEVRHIREVQQTSARWAREGMRHPRASS